MATITFGGITFFDDEPDEGFAVERLVGWYDAAPVRSEVDDIPTADGAFGVDEVYRGARVITVKGDWVGSSLTAAYQAREQIASLQPDGRPSAFTVVDPLGTRSCNVTLHSAPTVDDVLRSPYFHFEFDAVARDPRKYGPTVSTSTGLAVAGTGYVWPAVWPADWGSGGTSGRVDVTNPGTVTSYPMLEVVGGLTGGVELVEIVTGSVLRLERDIPSTGTVYFNMRTMRAYLDTPANDISGFLTRRDWWAVPGGGTRTVQLNPLGAVTGSPTLTARIDPAY